MALAITDDHAAQDPHFTMRRNGSATPCQLRERLHRARNRRIPHALVRFVGLVAYEAAGGGIRRDLFAEDDAGCT